MNLISRSVSNRSAFVLAILVCSTLASDPCWADHSKTKIALIISRYHEQITNGLLQGAQKQLFSQGVPTSHVSVIEAPGSFEIPLLAKKAARSGKYDAVVCLGLVILNSQTRDMHRSIVSSLQQIGLDAGIPVTYGIVAVDRSQDAMELTQPTPGSRGWGAAAAALKTLESLEKL